MLRDLNQWMQLEKMIDRAKEYISKSQNKINNESNKYYSETDNIEAKELISALTIALEKAQTNNKRADNCVSPRTRPRQNSILSNMHVIQEDPHFESMILCDNRSVNKINGIFFLLN